MAKLSVFFLLCSLSMALGNYYYQYAPAVPSALSYPYVQYGYAAAPYAVVAQQPDCDKKEKGESSSSESSSEESSSSSESSEEGEKKEEKEGEEGESKEGEEKEEGEEKKEGEEKEESSSSSSSSEESEEKEKKEEKKEKKEEKKEEKSLFPPRATYAFPPVQQVVYAPPTYSYMQPYKTYSIIQAPVSYPAKSAYVAPYTASVKSYSPMTKIIQSVPATARYVSVPAAVASPKAYSGYPSYLSSGLGLSSYLGNNVAYYKA